MINIIGEAIQNNVIVHLIDRGDEKKNAPATYKEENY